jgi:phospholipid transport system substrate-binding protein
MMFLSRQAVMAVAVTMPLLALSGVRTTTRAQVDTQGEARAFVQSAGDDLVRAVNSTAPDAKKKVDLQRIVDRVVDVDEFGKFALGRFWNNATPQQQAEFIRLFHMVLMNNLTGKLSQYAGVGFSVGRAVQHADMVIVETVVTWPGYAPYNVQWSVRGGSGALKIVDVNAMGTSMRLTQRNDYAGFMSRNAADVDALIAGMRRQVGE